MKKSIFMLSLLAIVSTFVWSCKKSEDGIKPLDTNLVDNKSVEHIEFDVGQEQGMLKFKDFESFINALEYFSDSEEKYFTDEARDAWEKSKGLNSLRAKYAGIRDQYENLDDAQFEQFSIENSELLDEEGLLSLPVRNDVLTGLLNEDGCVLINDALVCYTDVKQIIITDRDVNKLNQALQTLETNAGQGIYVYDYIETGTGFRTQCNGTTFHGGNAESNGRKLTGTWWVENHTTWWFPVFHHMMVCQQIKSYRKNWRGKWKRNRRDYISISLGYDIFLPTLPNVSGSLNSGSHKTWCLSNCRTISPAKFLKKWPSGYHFTRINAHAWNNSKNFGHNFNCQD